MLLTKTVRSQVELLLTNNPWGTGGALQSALQNTRVSAGWLHTLWLKAEFGSRSTVPSQQKRSIDFIHVREARVMSASRKSTVPAGIGAAPVLSETSVPLCRGMSYLSATCGPCQKGDLRLSWYWDLINCFHLTNVRQSHEAGFDSGSFSWCQWELCLLLTWV